MYLLDYIENFRLEIEKLEAHGFTESMEIKEEIRANRQAVLTAEVVFFNGSGLHIKEYIDGRYGIERISYAYHFQNIEGNCIFRYDNAVHKPHLHFKNHKHTRTGEIIMAPLPSIPEILSEVIGYL